MSRETAIRAEDARLVEPRTSAGGASLVRVIEPPSGHLSVDWAELWRYRDLLRFLVWRDIKVRYAQSVLGIGWAIIQPLFSMVIFTIVFGRLARIDSDGAPYAIFSYTALVPWTYFSVAVADSTASLVNAAGMLSKVYFPRLVIPLTPLLAKLLDFAIAMVVLGGMMVWFQVQPTVWVLFVPLLVVMMMGAAFGTGMWLTALNVQYRDVRYAVGLLVQLWMYASPVVYPASLVPESLRLLYGLNPMAGVIEGFRAALLGTVAMPWDLIGVGAGTTVVLLVSGAYYFRRMEDVFADVV
jgi:lipopolysaccharide transport system permease protein